MPSPPIQQIDSKYLQEIVLNFVILGAVRLISMCLLSAYLFYSKA